MKLSLREEVDILLVMAYDFTLAVSSYLLSFASMTDILHLTRLGGIQEIKRIRRQVAMKKKGNKNGSPRTWLFGR